MCKKYLRGVCGDLLDTYNGGDSVTGSNFEVSSLMTVMTPRIGAGSIYSKL